MPTSGTPTRWKICSSPSNTHLISASSTQGTTISRASVRGSRRSCRSTRIAVARTIRPLRQPTSCRNADSTSSAPVRASSCSLDSHARIRPSRISTIMSQRSASSITWLDTSSVVPASASRRKSAHSSVRSTGSRPDRRLVQHQQLGRVEQRRCQRHARPLAAGQRPDDAPGLLGQPDRTHHLVHPIGRGAQNAGEVAEVLAHRQVEVHGWRLGDIAHPPSQAGAPGRLTEHRHVARRDDLNADDRAHQRRLAAPAGTRAIR